jgi:hypothetical protein
MMPQPSSEATLTLLTCGTKTNSTHFQYTAVCVGCTTIDDNTLNPNGENRFAFAQSPSQPSNVGDPNSLITVHDVHGAWMNNFAEGKNSNFDTLVTRNQGVCGGPTTT